jgi:hypothetical protein
MDFTIVTLGLLLGLALNNCSEKRQERKQVQLYLQGIKEELIANKDILEEVHPYHLELLQTLREDPLNAQLTLSPGSITNSAWRLAENVIFKKHIDPRIYKTISAVYTTHDFLTEESAHASRLMSESNILGTFYLTPLASVELTREDELMLAKDLKQGWIPVFETWTGLEMEYLEGIDIAIQMLEEEGI